MDALSQMLRTIRLQGASFFESDLEKRCYLPPAPRALEANQMPCSERVVAFHLVIEGKCVAWLPGSEPIELSPGDLALFPVADNLGPIELRHESSHSIVERLGRSEAHGVFMLGCAKMICGYLECDEFIASPAFRKMPQALHLKSNPAVTTWLRALMSACLIELGSKQVGSSIIVERIAELMLMEAVRHYVINNPEIEHAIDIRQQS